MGGNPLNRKALAGMLLGSLLALNACMSDAPFKLPYAVTPAEVQGDWAVSSPEAQGIDSGVLRATLEPLFAESEVPNLRSILIARHGVLVAEAYLRDPADRTRSRPVMSATKSITSILLGIARDQGKIRDVDQTLGELIPERVGQDAAKGRITLRDLLTMRSGIAYSNDAFSLDMEYDPHPDSAALILSRPLAHDVGSVFSYKDADPHLVGAVLQKVTGQPLEQFARAHLFGPLGIPELSWLRHRDGTTYGAYGVSLRPRELLRLGQLCLQGGVWQDKRIVSAEWLTEATAPRLEAKSMPRHPDFNYGYYWWVDAGKQWYAAWGHGGQFVFVKPSRDLVVVTTADPNSDGDHVALTLERLVSIVTALEAGMTE